MMTILLVHFSFFLCPFFHVVVRIEKIKPILPKLNIIAANEEITDIMDRSAMHYLTPSPSPSPQPMDYIDPEIDPDNVVIRGSITDDEDNDA